MARKGNSTASSLKKMLRVMKLFSESPDWGVGEITTRLGIPRSTAHRILQALTNEGFLEQGTRRRYRLGPASMMLADVVVRVRGTVLFSFPELLELSRRTGEAVNLGIPVESGMVYVHKVRSQEPLAVDLPVGTIVPFHCTAIGKAFWAFSGRDPSQVRLTKHTPNTITHPKVFAEELGEIHQRGWALDREEYLRGVMGIGVPILNGSGHAVAAVALAIPSARFHAELQQAWVSALFMTATKLRSLFVGFPPSPYSAGTSISWL